MNEALKEKIERVAEKCLDSIESFIEESKENDGYSVYEMNESLKALKQIIDITCKLDAYNSEAYTLESSGLTCKPEKTPYKV